MIRCKSCFEQYDEKFNVCPYCGYYEDMQENPINRLPHGVLLNGRYIVGKTLGVGGFGITYKAWDTKLETIVAIKEYYPSAIVNRAPGSKDIILVDKKSEKIFKVGYNRLLDESRYVAKMQGKSNILNVNAFFEENNTTYMVMEYLEGTQLRDIVRKRGKISVEEAVDMITKICDAIKIVHNEKILHRDVAPDNIIVDTDSNGKISRMTLIDFGNARLSGVSELDEIIVKEGFSPIEQYDTVHKQGAWTDIYAIGATFYYALTGIKPDESRNRKEEDKLVPLHELDSSIPINLSNVIMRAMAIDEHLRYQSVEDMKKDLFKDKVPTVKQVVRKKRLKRAISIVAVMIAIGLGFVYFTNNYMVKRAEVHLPYNTSITMWIMADEGSEKENAFKNMISVFEESYEADKIKVNLVVIPEDEYEERIEAAIKNNKLPEIFENNTYSDKYAKHTEKVRVIANSVKDDIYFSEEIIEMAKENEILVYGFDMPVLYVNTNLYEGELNYQDILSELDIEDVTEHNDLEAFLNNEDEVYYGYSSELEDARQIQERAGVCEMVPIEGKLKCKYSIALSMAEGGKDEKEVAETLLLTMYSDASEDAMFIQSGMCIQPLNKSTLKMYDNSSDFTGFFENIEDYQLK
ncbi:MAG: protein kinase [Lachnospiraceae bacterium]|nr:protein kinase [Lachnospiraceae bacterium]